MTPDIALDTLLEVLELQTGQSRKALLAAPSPAALGLDSLQIFEVLASLEDQLGVEINLNDASEAQTLEQLAHVIAAGRPQ